MSFGAFGVHVGQYLATPPDLTDADFSVVLLDIKGRIVQDQTTSSIKIGDGTDILDVLVEDEAFANASKGLLPLVVRKDTLASLVDTDGDLSPLAVDQDGRLYVTLRGERTEHQEDSQHASGHYGNLPLAVRNDTEGSLVDANGDYAPFQVDALGRLRVAAEIDLTPGADGDKGSDEVGDGEITGVKNDAFYDIATIDLATIVKYYLQAFDFNADKACNFRLIVWNSDTEAIVKVIRTVCNTESKLFDQCFFPRPKEVAGGANLELKLQAKKIRNNPAADAIASGGINGYYI